MKNIATTSFLLASLLSLPACAGSTYGTQNVSPESSAHFVQIENDGLLDANVYIVIDEQLQHLDFVTGMQQDTVRIPRGVVPGMELRALVDPVGSSAAYLSEPVPYSGTQDFALMIANNLALTSFYPTSSLAAGMGK
jgi:hypothetical protein